MDFVKSFLPEGKGVLPYYMLVVCSPLREYKHLKDKA